MPLNPSILRYQPVETPDPGQTFARYLSLREMLDQRRYRDQQYRAQELLARQREQEFQEGQNLRQLFAGGAEPTPQQIMAASPTKGLAILREQRQAETAGVQQRTAQLEFDTKQKEQMANDIFAVLSLPSEQQAPAYRQLNEVEYVNRGWRKPGDPYPPMPTPEQAKAIAIQGFGQAKWEELENKRATEARAKAEEKRKADEAARKEALAPYEAKKTIAEAETAERKALGIQEPTAEEQTFRSLFLPGWLKMKNLTATPENVTQAYGEFIAARRPQFAQPGVDVPLPPAVAQQRIDIATAQAKAAATDKPLSAEAAKVKTVADTLIPEAQQLKAAIASGGRAAITGILTGTDTTLRRLAESVADKVGRLRSGGAINKDEEARFMGQIATWRDIWGGGQAPMDALDRLITEAQGVSGSMGGKPAQAPAGGKKDSLGIR